MFVKHYAPNYMLAPKDNKGIIKILWKSPKTDQVIYIMYTNCMPDNIILDQAVLQLFCSQVSFTTQYAKVEKGW